MRKTKYKKPKVIIVSKEEYNVYMRNKAKKTLDAIIKHWKGERSKKT